MIYWSPSTKGFYDTDLKRPQNFVMPDDVIQVTKEERQYLLDQERQNKVIEIGGSGRPEARTKRLPRDKQTITLKSEVNIHINEQARSEGFDSILDAVSYAEEPTDPGRQAKGRALRAWRSACWLVVDEQLQNDQLPNLNQLIALLPNYNDF